MLSSSRVSSFRGTCIQWKMLQKRLKVGYAIELIDCNGRNVEESMTVDARLAQDLF